MITTQEDIERKLIESCRLLNALRKREAELAKDLTELRFYIIKQGENVAELQKFVGGLH